MTTDYSATVYVQSALIGHAFIKLEAPGQSPIVVGYYPVEHSPQAPGTLRNDAGSGISLRGSQSATPTQHAGEPIKSFDISSSQYSAMVEHAAWVANHPEEYGVLNNQCTSFVVDTLSAGGIGNSENYANATIMHPTDLKVLLRDLPIDQVRPQGPTPNGARLTATIKSLYDGIDAHDPQADGYRASRNARIAPIGTVAIDESLKSPPTASRVAQNIRNHLSPDGKEPLGVQISDGVGKTHYWQPQNDGSVVRSSQQNFDGGGTMVTVTTYLEGATAPAQERQIVSGTNGIVSDALLRPDTNGRMAVDKIRLGGVLDASPTGARAIAPLPKSRDAADASTADGSDAHFKNHPQSTDTTSPDDQEQNGPIPQASSPSSSIDRVQYAINDLIGGKHLPNRLGRVAATTDADIKPFWVPIMGSSNDADSEGADAATALYCPWTHTIQLNADQINEGDESATLAQALMHKHGQSVLGQPQWDRLNDAVHAWQDADPKSDEYAVYNYARNQAQAAGADPAEADLLPYALEATQQLGGSPRKALKPGSAARWQESVRQNMKAAWNTITDNPDLFKEQDLAELAHGMAQRDSPAVARDETTGDNQDTAIDKLTQDALAA